MNRYRRRRTLQAGGVTDQSLGEFDDRLVGEARQQDMLQRLQLPCRAALMRGLLCPKRLTHHELMASR